MRAILIIEQVDFRFRKDDYIVAIDKGIVAARKMEVPIDLAIGDFDSLEYEYFYEADKVIMLDVMKDDTDTLAAVKQVENYDEIVILGGIKGDRIEHFYANLMIINKYENVKMLDDNSLMYALNPGVYPMEPDEYNYISLFALDEVEGLSLKGFKYPLSNYRLVRENIVGISNEITKKATLSFESGRLLVIKTKSTHKLS